MIFRGLFFEHNADIGQKNHLWADTRYIIDLFLNNIKYFFVNGLTLLYALQMTWGNGLLIIE